MTNNIKELLNQYDLNNVKDIRYPLSEILQKVILVVLSRIGFFDNVAFCGGTALRIFHNLNRFSEDLDFNVLDKNKTFDFSKYETSLIQQLKSFGINLNVDKRKNKDPIYSILLSTSLYKLVDKHCDKKFLNDIRANEKIKIKIEVDSNSPLIGKADVEERILYEPLFAKVKILKLETLFAGKLNAILTRPLSLNKPKGRDYYDYIFYVSKHIKPNLVYLQHSLSQFNIWDKNKVLDIKQLKSLLTDNFKKVNFDWIKKDVEPLIQDKNEIDSWSNETFLLTIKDFYS